MFLHDFLHAKGAEDFVEDAEDGQFGNAMYDDVLALLPGIFVAFE
jgi:hypothetical protein